MALSAGSTLVPVLLTSDQTFLTNFSGDKKLWPLFMSSRNIHSRIQNKPIMQAWILIGLLPIGPKRTQGIKSFNIHQQEYDSLTVQHRILERIVEPLSSIYQVWSKVYIALESLLLTHDGRAEDVPWLALMKKSGGVFLSCHLGLQIIWKM